MRSTIRYQGIMEIINVKTGDTLFHSVVAAGLESTREFCENPSFDDEILEVSNKLKQRPLHLAVASLDVKLVEYLLKKGAEVDAFKKGDWTSLMIASALNKPQALQIVQILLQHGANPRLKNKDGWTAMHFACKAGNIDLVSQLASAEPKLVLEPSRNGRIPLHIAALNGHSDLVLHLIGLGGLEMCNTIDACGSTPAMDAVSSGSMQTLEAICCHVVLSSQVDKWGLTCLHKAAQLGHSQLVQFLVQAGVQVNAQTPSEGYTALHYAVAEKQADTVLKLLQLGADLTLCNKYNETALELPRGLTKTDIDMIIEDNKRFPL